MNSFVRKFAPVIKGVLSGFDRLVFRGLVRQFSYAEGLLGYLCHHGIRLKDFGDHAQAITEQVKQASLAEAQRLGREVRYLQDSEIRKDDLAREIAVRDRIDRGLICILTAVEPCRSYDVVGNPQTHQIELRLRWRKCLHLYHYLIHPVFGFMSVRLQTWYPFTMQVCLNGRKLNRDGSVPGTFRGEVTSDVKTRSEGVRIQYRLHGNSLKIYDKHLNLRFEMTMNNPRDFKVFRRKEGETEGPREWLPLRKGIADLKRRATASGGGLIYPPTRNSAVSIAPLHAAPIAGLDLISSLFSPQLPRKTRSLLDPTPSTSPCLSNPTNLFQTRRNQSLMV